MRQSLAKGILLSGLLAGAAHVEAAPILWSTGDGGNGHYYDVVLSDNPTWSSANAAASGMSYSGLNGHLATFVTRAEQEFVIQALGGGHATNQLWLGGYQDTNAADYSEPYGGWRWVTGEAWLGVAANDPVIPRADAGFNNSYFDGSAEGYTLTWWNSGGINDYSGTPAAQYSDPNGGPARGFIVEYENAAVPEPASWAMMVFGFAMVGAMRRRSPAPAC